MSPGLTDLLSPALNLMQSDATAREAVARMQSEGLDLLVVAEGRRPIGCLSSTQALRLLTLDAAALEQPLHGILQPPICVPPGMDRGSACTLSAQHGAAPLLVVDDKGDLLGLVKAEDLLLASSSREADAAPCCAEGEAAATPCCAEGDPILDVAPAILFMFDAEGRLTRWNQPYLETFGLSPADLPHYHALTPVPPDEFERARQGVDTVLAGGSITLEMDLIAADGSRHTYFGTAVPVDYAGRRHVGCLAVDISDRKQAEEVLHLYARMVSSMPDHISVLDRDYRYIAVNDAYLLNHGRQRESIVGHGVADLLGPAVFEGIVKPRLDRCLAGEPVHYQDWFDFPESGRRFMSVTYTPYRRADADGENHGVIVASRDLTDLELAHQALMESEQRFRILVDQAADALYVHDQDGQLVDVNQRACDSLGYTRAALLGKHILEIEQDFELDAARTLWHSLQPGQMTTFPGRHRRKDGTTFPVELHISCHDLQGRRLITALARDITARLQAEERLRQAAAVFDNAQEGIMVTDPQARILAVNAAFCEISGCTEADVLGKTPALFKSGRHDEVFYRTMWTSLEKDGRWQGEVWDRRLSGEIFPKWLSVSAIRDANGQVSHYVGLFADISRLKETEERLQHLAHYDALTDLPNRLLFNSRLEHALEQAKRHQQRIAVMFIDLDHFKTVNDSLGHAAGDELLVAVARRIRARLREEDTLARLGGDEFVVLLENLDDAQIAAVVAQDLIETLAEPVSLSSGHDVVIGGSVGISLYPEDAAGPIQLVRNADAALYQAKEQGRNTYRFYTESLTRRAQARLDMETMLRQALERKEFVLHYQPQVDVADGRIIGVEALVRWQHPEEGLIPPGQFIPLAEDTGLIVPLGEWVLSTACAQMQAWLAQGIAPINLAVNLSSRQFRGADLAEKVNSILQATGLPARYLELELTESTLMEPGTEAITTVDTIKALGIRLAIDDFGTGYSSLAYLKRFAVDKLKIDTSFVRDIPNDQNDMQIAASIIALGHNLHLQVLAEGVETPAQLAFLKTHGCNACQGFLFSRPLPASELESLLRGSFSPADSA